MLLFMAIAALNIADVFSFVPPGPFLISKQPIAAPTGTRFTAHPVAEHTWSPQDLTKNNPGYLEIPHGDYVKKYMENPDFWPVEFFLVPYRRTQNPLDDKTTIEILVRKSANGTSRFGLGTGVPVTRWIGSSDKLPRGYEWTEPPIFLEASAFPEFPKISESGQPTKAWNYRKISIRKDSFKGELKDDELREYARKIRNHLKDVLSVNTKKDRANLGHWEMDRVSLILELLETESSLAAIQGTLRMSGLFEKRSSSTEMESTENPCTRFVDLENGPDSLDLVRAANIYTMFPQMPDPMPLPNTPSDELREEIRTRPSRMKRNGRDPHKDKYGRIYTHISTSNVSNTIHGIYLPFDATDFLPAKTEGESTPPARDLFGTKSIPREWKSLQELKVLNPEGLELSTEDPKSVFISGFIVRELVRSGAI